MTRPTTLRVGAYELRVRASDQYLIIARDGTDAADLYAASDWGDGELTWWPGDCQLPTDAVNHYVWSDRRVRVWADYWLDVLAAQEVAS